MDYANTGYAEAKQLIKVAEPPVPTAPAADSSWLADLPGKFQASYTKNPLPWQLGIGGLGGAGLGALSSLWQPKRRKNPWGRALTGGLLGALAGGAYNLVQGANLGAGAAAKKSEQELALIDANEKLRGAYDRDVYGPDGKNTAIERLRAGIGGGVAGTVEALGSQSGVESVGEDISSVMSGKAPQYLGLPEAGGIAGAMGINRFRNRSKAVLGQMKRDLKKLEGGPATSKDIPKVVAAEQALRGGYNPLKKRLWQGLPGRIAAHLRHGSARTRVMGGEGTKIIPKDGVETRRFGKVTPAIGDTTRWSEDLGQARANLKARRGGRLRRGAKTGILAGIIDLLIRGGLESDPVSGRGAARTQSRHLDVQDAIRRAKADADAAAAPR